MLYLGKKKSNSVYPQMDPVILPSSKHNTKDGKSQKDNVLFLLLQQKQPHNEQTTRRGTQKLEFIAIVLEILSQITRSEIHIQQQM